VHGNVALSRLAGVDVDGVVVGLHVQADLFPLVLSRIGSHLGSVERGDLASDDIGGLDAEVDIVDAKLLVEPANLLLNEGLGDPSSLNDDVLDCSDIALGGILYKLGARPGRGHLPAFICSSFPVNSGAT